ncbi:MAG: hypothetical protein JXQ83_13275 [Candidatus Glassbacteria bacterium]|nr:hypothetical protein [Candidatus Glassbacteria bacterium]
MRRTDRREDSPAQGKRGLFGGNVSVRYGLLTVLFCVVIVQFYYRALDVSLDGPIDDIFRKKAAALAIVYGTGGDSGKQLADYAHKVSELLGRKLSAVIPVYPDTAVAEKTLRERSLILYGPVGENSVADRMRDSFPFSFSGSGLISASGTITPRPWRLIFIVPNPFNTSQYVLVYTAAEAQDVVGINLLGHPNFTRGDTSDYVLASGSGIVRKGFFDKEDNTRWRLVD